MTQWVKNLPAKQETQETQVRSLGRKEPLEEKKGNPLHYSCLENLMDRGAWQAIVHGVAKNQMQLSDFEQESIWGHNICGHKILWL